MKKCVLCATVFVCLLAACSEKKKTESPESIKKVEATGYDSVMAQKMHADEYGMRKYVMAFLVTGDSSITDTTKMQELQLAHLKNIGRMAKEGKLAVAGPFLDGGNVHGVYIFNVETVEEAQALVETDPMIKARVLKMELHPWYGSAAVSDIANVHKHLQKKSITG
jgi:uncharacterized protein YciI